MVSQHASSPAALIGFLALIMVLYTIAAYIYDRHYQYKSDLWYAVESFFRIFVLNMAILSLANSLAATGYGAFIIVGALVTTSVQTAVRYRAGPKSYYSFIPYDVEAALVAILIVYHVIAPPPGHDSSWYFLIAPVCHAAAYVGWSLDWWVKQSRTLELIWLVGEYIALIVWCCIIVELHP